MSQAVETSGRLDPGEPGDQGRPSPEPSPLDRGWWSVAIFVGGCLTATSSISDNSLLTHLATGRLIRSGGVPRVDPYGLTGGRWVAQSWLASWWYATLEALGGAAMIRLSTSLMTGALAVLLWRLARPVGDLIGRVALVGSAFALGLFWWTDRPQLIAYLLLAVMLVVLAERRSVWWCAPILALWVNVHGSWPLGLLVVAMWAVRESVSGRWSLRRGAGAIAASILGIGLGAWMSPYGTALLRFPLDMAHRTATLAFIREWRAPALDSLGTWLFILEVALIVAALWRHRAWGAMWLAGVFVALAAIGVRNMAVASIALVPLSAPYVSGAALGRPRRDRSAGETGTVGSVKSVSPRRRRAALAAGLCLVVALIGFTPDYDLSPYPTRAVDWLEARGWVATPSVRIVSHDFVGNYLEWRFGRRAHPWLDDRVELTTYAELRDYVSLLSNDTHFEETLARYSPDLVVWMTDESLAAQLAASPAYRVIYRDDVSIVACRVGGSLSC